VGATVTVTSSAGATVATLVYLWWKKRGFRHHLRLRREVHA